MKDATIRLLEECYSGTVMGVASIDEVLSSVKDQNLLRLLRDSKADHEKLGKEADSMLRSYNRDGPEPGMMAKGMSWMKTNLKLTMNPTDAAVADLITDGCHMGIKSLQQMLNDCAEAEPKAIDLTQQLMDLEDDLAENLRSYL